MMDEAQIRILKRVYEDGARAWGEKAAAETSLDRYFLESRLYEMECDRIRTLELVLGDKDAAIEQRIPFPSTEHIFAPLFAAAEGTGVVA
jgi:hypothetical protein